MHFEAMLIWYCSVWYNRCKIHIMCQRLRQAVVWKRNEYWKTNNNAKFSRNIYPRIISSNNEYLPQVLAVRVHSTEEMNIVMLQLSFISLQDQLCSHRARWSRHRPMVAVIHVPVGIVVVELMIDRFDTLQQIMICARTAEQTIDMPAIWHVIALIMTSHQQQKSVFLFF